MHNRRNILSFLLFSLIPVLLLSACSDKSKYVRPSDDGKPWLGVKVRELSDNRLDDLNLDFGLEVLRVYADSPAEEAGLQEGDILLRLNGKALEDSEDLIESVERADIDDRVNISYLRDGEQKDTDAVLTEKTFKFSTKHFSWHYPAKKYHYSFRDKNVAWLGVSTSRLTSQLRDYFDVEGRYGVLVTEVVDDSPAEKYGLKAGDIIVAVDNRDIYDPRDLSKVIHHYDPDEKVSIHVIRDKREKTIEVTLGQRKAADFRYFGYTPHEIEIDIPEIDIDIPEIDIEVPDIDIPEIDIEVPDIDEEEWEELNERLNEEMEERSEELEIKMEELEEKLEKMEIKLRNTKSAVI